jgi:hypothetical protein
MRVMSGSSGGRILAWFLVGNFPAEPAFPNTFLDRKGGVMTSGVLISILVTFLVIILVLYLINMLPIDGRAKQIVRIIVIVIGVLSLLKYIAVF